MKKVFGSIDQGRFMDVFASFLLIVSSVPTLVGGAGVVSTE
jgi:hypothetical protein